MKILVVHDRPEVAIQIEEIARASVESITRIDTAEDYHSARACLAKDIYDLLIVDLTIPMRKGKTTADFQAVSTLLHELFDMDALNIPGDVIGMTRDPTALGLVDADLGPHLMIAISEDDAGNWKKYLRDKIVYAKRANEVRSISINQHYSYDLLIVTAVDKEMRPFESAFELTDVSYFEGAKEFLFEDKSGAIRKGVAYSIGRSGQPSAASMSQSLISTFRPRLALMSGYCGGIETKVALGDLIFFESAYAWDYGKWKEVEEGGEKKARFVSRPNPLDITDQKTHRVAREMIASDFARLPQLKDRVAQLSKGALSDIKLHLCHVGSGSAVVSHNQIISDIRNLDDSIWAVDMECYGFYYSARYTNVIRPEFLCLKAVSDFCNGEKGDTLHEVCSDIAASAVVDIIKNRWDFEADL